MLDLSPHFFSPTFAWHVEEDMIDELSYGDLFASSTPNETRISHNSVTTSSPPLPGYEHDAALYNSDPAIKDHPNSAKKSSHNAYERDRRKKLNSLYSSLRSLLPETNQNKKLSIPTTVARVIKHIPELQRQIERLIRRKEEILLRVSKEGSELSSKVTYESKATTYPVVSATCLNRREFMVQIVFINESVKIPLSKVVKLLEEQGLQLMNASTLTAHADSTFYSLHLQAKNPIMMEGHIFCEHLMRVLREQARVG